MRVSSSSLRTKKAVFKPVAASNLRWLLRLVVPLELNMSIQRVGVNSTRRARNNPSHCLLVLFSLAAINCILHTKLATETSFREVYLRIC